MGCICYSESNSMPNSPQLSLAKWRELLGCVQVTTLTVLPEEIVNWRSHFFMAALFEEISVEHYEELNRVNYLGVVYTVKAGYASIQRG